MRIVVNIYSYLKSYIPDAENLMKAKTWEMPDNATVGEVVGRLNLPEKVHVTVMVNHNSVTQKAILKEGDIVHILPQMGGG